MAATQYLRAIARLALSQSRPSVVAEQPKVKRLKLKVAELHEADIARLLSGVQTPLRIPVIGGGCDVKRRWREERNVSAIVPWTGTKFHLAH